MALTPLSNLPTQSDPSTFNTRAETFINSQLPNLVSEWNADIQTFNNASTTATSTTSTTIGLGSRTFTIQSNKTFFAGMRVRVAFSATEWMEGHVSSYSGSTLIVLVDLIGATVTTRTSWNIFLVPAIDVTAWTSYTPVITSGAGTITTKVGFGRYKQIGKTVFVSLRIEISANGTGSSSILFTLPVNANNVDWIGSGRNVADGKMLQALGVSATQGGLLTFDNGYPLGVATTGTVRCSFTYEAA